MTPDREHQLNGVRVRLFRALRLGVLGIEHRGFLLGFGKAMKSPDHNRPSQLQIDIAERLDAETKFDDGSESQELIDREDIQENPAGFVTRRG